MHKEALMFKSKYSTLILVLIISLLCVMIFPEFSIAGPGGFVKAAARTFWGKVVIFALIIFFAPLVIWYLLSRTISIRRTKKHLKQLSKIDSNFDWMQIKERVTEVFYWVHSAWDQKNMELAKDYVEDWYIRNQQMIIDKWEREGIMNIVSHVKIKSINPLYVSYNPNEPSKNRIVLEIDAEMRDYLVDIASSKVVKGDKTLGDMSTVWSFIFKNNKWTLSMIEESDTVMDYLSETNDVPILVDEKLMTAINYKSSK